MTFRDAVCWHNSIYVYDNVLFALCEINTISHKVKVVYRNQKCKDTVRQIFDKNNKVIMVSTKMNVIMIYDIERSIFERYLINENDGEVGMSFIVDDKLICISTQNASNSYIFNLTQKTYEVLGAKYNTSNCMCPSIWDKKIYLPNSNRILICGVENQNEDVELDFAPLKPYMVACEKDVMLMIEKKADCIYKYEFSTKSLTKIIIPQGEYGRIMILSGVIWLLPRKGSSVIALNGNNEEIIMSFSPDSEWLEEVAIESTVFTNCIELTDCFLLIPNNIKPMYMVNKETFEVSRYGLDETEYDVAVVDEYITTGTIIRENKDIGLSELLSCILTER